MGWETRERGGSYYYRKERDGDRVKSVYVGSGLLGQFSAMALEQEQQERDARRRALRREIETQRAIDSQIDDVGEFLQEIVAAALIASGYHQHKRQWRRKRDAE